MLDVAAINSSILYNLKHPDLSGARQRRKSIEELSCNLIKSCALNRYNLSAMNNHIGLNRNIMASSHRLLSIDQTVSAANTNNKVLAKRYRHIKTKKRQ